MTAFWAEFRTVSIWYQVGRDIDDYQAGIRSLPVSLPESADELRADLVSRFDFERPVPLPQLTAEVTQLLRDHSTHVTHPRYFGLFNPSVFEAAVVADALVAAFNPQLATWTHAPAANELERLTLTRLARTLGFDANGVFANFTTGGFEANLSAVAVALGHAFPEHAASGIRGSCARPVIYVTDETHHSFVKICRLTGLGTDALRHVETTSRLTMDTEALTRLIRSDREAGLAPVMIVGTVGTTGTGVIDPIPELAQIARESNVWLHVDAAWGGAAALVPRLRPAVAGISDADSVTWDAHKWLSVPMGAGMFFCRHANAVRRAFAVTTSYMPMPADCDTWDPYTATVQWSRRAIGLKLFMALAERGIHGVAAAIDRQARMGDMLRQRLATAGWVVVNGTPLPLVCATHADIRSGRVSTEHVVRDVNARGRVWISDVVARGERVIRACITSFRTDETDVAVLIDELECVRRRIREQR